MASLSSKIKSAAKNVSSKISSQAKAITKAITSNFAGKPNMTSVVTGKPVNSSIAPKPVGTSAVTKKPTTSVAGAKTVGTSVYTGKPATSIAGPRPNMTSFSSGKPTYAAPPKSNRSSGSSLAAGVGGAYEAIKNALGGRGGGGYASDDAPGIDGGGYDAPSYEYDSYRGNTGVTQRSYSSGQGQSLEAQARGESPTNMSATPDQRAAYRNTIGAYEAGAADREAQKQALQAQIALLQGQVNDATAAAMVADPLAEQPESEDDIVQRQLQEMEAEMERLNKVPEDVLKAQREEEALLAEEARIKDEMNKTLYGIKGQAIPQGFITGQGARVQDLANVGLDRIAGQRVTVQQKLANAQARRAAAMDVVKEKYNRLSDRRDTLDNRAYEDKKRKEDREAEAASKRYVTLSDGAQLYDTVTGKIVENPKNYAPKSAPAVTTRVVNVGGRQILVNAKTGAQIRDLGPSNTKASSGRSL